MKKNNLLPVTTYALEVFQKPSEVSTVHIVQSVTSAEVLVEHDEDVYPLFSKQSVSKPSKAMTFQPAAELFIKPKKQFDAYKSFHYHCVVYEFVIMFLCTIIAIILFLCITTRCNTINYF